MNSSSQLKNKNINHPNHSRSNILQNRLLSLNPKRLLQNIILITLDFIFKR